MSTLKVTHLQNENGTGPAMSIAVGGGVTFAGISTFHNGVDSGERLTIGGSTVTDSNLLTLNGTGATQNVGLVLNKTNSPARAYGMQVNNGTGDLIFFDYTASQERFRVDSDGNVGINRTDPNQRLNVNGNIEVNAYDSASGSGGYYTAKGLIIGNAYDAGKTTTDDRNAIIWQERGLDLDIATNDTLRMKITYDGKVGINTTTPDERLEVGNGTVSGGLKVSGQSSSVTSDGFTVDWESSTDSTRLFSEPQSGGSSQFKIYTTNSGTRSLAATFNSSGNLAFPSGQGVDFSADTNNGEMTSELLDDYEEGTWTPTIRENGTGTAWNTISNQVGTYTKVGQLVTVTFYFDYSARASNVTTSFYGFIAGLPFTNTSASTNGGAGTLLIAQSGGSATPYHIYLNTSQGNTLSVYGNQDSTTPGPLMTSEWPNVAARVRGQYFYYVP